LSRTTHYPRYRPSTAFARMTLVEIAAEIDRTPAQTERLLRKVRYLGLAPRRGSGLTTYDSRAVEVLKGLLGIAHRHVDDPADDWLSRWIGEQHHA